MAIKTLIVSFLRPVCHKPSVFFNVLDIMLPLADNHFPFQLGKQGEFLAIRACTRLELHAVGQQLFDFLFLVNSTFDVRCTRTSDEPCKTFVRCIYVALRVLFVKVGPNLIMCNTSRNGEV